MNKFLKHPIRSYKNMIKHSIIPKPYSHQVKMNILIKKGEQSGTALIPCTIYAMNHSIDLNPALIRKKDKKVVKCYNPKKYKFITDTDAESITEKKKVVRYNPNDYSLELTEDEKNQGYELKELERCKRCGQKLVVAELKQTRYRSCPSIHVKLGDKAKEDIVVPVEFGVNKSDITRRIWISAMIIPLFLMFSFQMFGLDFIKYLIHIVGLTGSITLSKSATNIIKIIFLVFLWGVITPIWLYGTYMLMKWYNSVKHTLKRSNYLR